MRRLSSSATRRFRYAVVITTKQSVPKNEKSPAICRAFLLHKTDLLRGKSLARVRLLVLTAETLNPARSVNQLLLTGKKWMARGTDFQADIALVRRVRRESAATRAMYRDLLVLRMNPLLRHNDEKSLQWR